MSVKRYFLTVESTTQLNQIKMNNFHEHIYNVFIPHVLIAHFEFSPAPLKKTSEREMCVDFYELKHKWYVCVYSAKNKNEIKFFIWSKVQ